jgi:hypothetical protein
MNRNQVHLWVTLPRTYFRSFVKHLEHNQILHIFQEHQILGYFHYVSDALVIYDQSISNIDST